MTAIIDSELSTHIYTVIIDPCIDLPSFFKHHKCRSDVGEFNPFYVASGSMIPNLNIHDFAFVSHNVPFNSLKVGDIIVFKT
jgi:Signal peptidase, peptidase S26